LTTENIEVEEEEIEYVRPVAMTLISLWLIFSGLMIFWYTLRGYGASSVLNTSFLMIGGVVSLVGGIGFWRMKKWALYVFAAFALIDQVVLLLLGRWNIFSLFYFAVLLYFGYKYRSEMT
jgi:hypothetical protein